MEPSKVYIFEDLKGMAESTRCLFENQNLPVDIVKYTDSLKTIPEMSFDDTVIIHLESSSAQGFILLNNLIFQGDRPQIVLTTDRDGMLGPEDNFPGNRVRILTQPVPPHALIEAVTLSPQ